MADTRNNPLVEDFRFPSLEDAAYIRLGAFALESAVMVQEGGKPIADRLATARKLFHEQVIDAKNTYMTAARPAFFIKYANELLQEVYSARKATDALEKRKDAIAERLKPVETIDSQSEIVYHLGLWEIRRFLLSLDDTKRYLIFSKAIETSDDRTIEAFVKAPEYFDLLEGGNFGLQKVEAMLQKHAMNKNPKGFGDFRALVEGLKFLRTLISDTEAEALRTINTGNASESSIALG